MGSSSEGVHASSSVDTQGSEAPEHRPALSVLVEWQPSAIRPRGHRWTRGVLKESAHQSRGSTSPSAGSKRKCPLRLASRRAHGRTPTDHAYPERPESTRLQRPTPTYHSWRCAPMRRHGAKQDRWRPGPVPTCLDENTCVQRRRDAAPAKGNRLSATCVPRRSLPGVGDVRRAPPKSLGRSNKPAANIHAVSTPQSLPLRSAVPASTDLLFTRRVPHQPPGLGAHWRSGSMHPVQEATYSATHRHFRGDSRKPEEKSCVSAAHTYYSPPR